MNLEEIKEHAKNVAGVDMTLINSAVDDIETHGVGSEHARQAMSDLHAELHRVLQQDSYHILQSMSKGDYNEIMSRGKLRKLAQQLLKKKTC